MKMPPITPGPWKVFRSTDGRVILGVGDKDAGGITDCGDVSTNDQGLWRDGREREANAKAIAAVPQMIEALNTIVADCAEVVARGSASRRTMRCHAVALAALRLAGVGE